MKNKIVIWYDVLLLVQSKVTGTERQVHHTEDCWVIGSVPEFPLIADGRSCPPSCQVLRAVPPLTRTPELLLHSDHGGIFCLIFSLPSPRAEIALK